MKRKAHKRISPMVECPNCKGLAYVTPTGKFRKHYSGWGWVCDWSGKSALAPNDTGQSNG